MEFIATIEAVYLVAGMLLIMVYWSTPMRMYGLGAEITALIGTCFLGIGIGDDNKGSIIFGVLLLGLSIYIFFIAHRGSQKAEKVKQEVAQLATFDEKTNILTLNGRGAQLNSCIVMKEHKRYDISHKDDEYIYTGATSGGITMGGVTKFEGYDYISKISKTNRYELNYYGKSIFKIRLSSDLLSQAKVSPIKEYLDNGTEIIVVDPKKFNNMGFNQRDLVQLMRTNRSMYLSVTGRMMEPGYPEYEKCKKIYDWICNDK